MSLKTRHILDLSRVVDVVSKIQGVLGIFLFGSLARGDYDKYSDYDLLVIFEDKALMWRNWDELFRSVSSLKMNLHMIPETLEELKAANPVFLDELSKRGKVLFSKLPLEVFLKPLELEPFSLILYNMAGLSYRDKMKVSYLIHKKGGGGAIAKVGAVKLGEGCILVPRNTGEEFVAMLRDLGVNVKRVEIYLSGDQSKAWLDQKSTVT